jgi:hypothetical protein
MTETLEAQTMTVMDKNFNIINLLLFASLYVVCFVYLLQDTVNPVGKEFSNIIGMFVGHIIFFILICGVIFQELQSEKSKPMSEHNLLNILKFLPYIKSFFKWINENTNFINSFKSLFGFFISMPFILIVTSLGVIASLFTLLLKYNSVQGRTNGETVFILDEPTDGFWPFVSSLFTHDIKNNYLEYYKYLFIGFDLTVVALLLTYLKSPAWYVLALFIFLFLIAFASYMIHYNLYENDKSIFIAINAVSSFFILLLPLNYFKNEYVSGVVSAIIAVFLCLILIGAAIMLYLSSLISNTDPQPTKKDSSPSISPRTIPALIIMCGFHIMFTFFISFLMSKQDLGTANWTMIISWGSIFISLIFLIISLFMVIITYKYMNDNFLVPGKDVPNKNKIYQELKDYNNLFVAAISVIIVFAGTLLYGKDFIKTQKNVFFEPYYYSGSLCAMGVASISMSSEMIVLANDFLKFKTALTG